MADLSSANSDELVRTCTQQPQCYPRYSPQRTFLGLALGCFSCRRSAQSSMDRWQRQTSDAGSKAHALALHLLIQPGRVSPESKPKLSVADPASRRPRVGSGKHVCAIARRRGAVVWGNLTTKRARAQPCCETHAFATLRALGAARHALTTKCPMARFTQVSRWRPASKFLGAGVPLGDAQ